MSFTPHITSGSVDDVLTPSLEDLDHVRGERGVILGPTRHRIDLAIEELVLRRAVAFQRDVLRVRVAMTWSTGDGHRASIAPAAIGAPCSTATSALLTSASVTLTSLAA